MKSVKSRPRCDSMRPSCSRPSRRDAASALFKSLYGKIKRTQRFNTPTRHQAAAVRRRCSGFNPQDLSNLAWALASGRLAEPSEVLACIESAAVGQIEAFKPQELSNLAWAFATCGEGGADALFCAVERALLARLDADADALAVQAISNTCWAFASAGHCAPKLFAQLAPLAEHQIHRFPPQALANTAWAYAKCRRDHPDADAADAGGGGAQQLLLPVEVVSLFAAIEQRCVSCARDFEPRQLSSLAWAPDTSATRENALGIQKKSWEKNGTHTHTHTHTECRGSRE